MIAIPILMTILLIFSWIGAVSNAVANAAKKGSKFAVIVIATLYLTVWYGMVIAGTWVLYCK